MRAIAVAFRGLSSPVETCDYCQRVTVQAGRTRQGRNFCPECTGTAGQDERHAITAADITRGRIGQPWA